MSEDGHLQTSFPVHRGNELLVGYFTVGEFGNYAQKPYSSIMSFLALLSATAWGGLHSTPEKQDSRLLMRLFKNLREDLREI